MPVYEKGNIPGLGQHFELTQVKLGEGPLDRTRMLPRNIGFLANNWEKGNIAGLGQYFGLSHFKLGEGPLDPIRMLP